MCYLTSFSSRKMTPFMALDDVTSFLRFEWLARAHCPAGASDLVHFVVKIAVEKVGSEKISMLLALLCKINFSVLFL